MKDKGRRMSICDPAFILYPFAFILSSSAFD